MKGTGKNMMNKKTEVLIGAVVAVVILIISMIGSYNSLISKETKVSESMANIDTQLTRRADLIPNLVNTVKGYAAHETAVFESVTQARENMLGAQTVSEKAEASDELTGALGKLIAIAEAYPELKSDTLYVSLMDELAGTENRIAISRENYNGAVAAYNKSIKIFPTSIIANMAGFHKAELFEASESAKEVPNIEF